MYSFFCLSWDIRERTASRPTRSEAKKLGEGWEGEEGKEGLWNCSSFCGKGKERASQRVCLVALLAQQALKGQMLTEHLVGFLEIAQ